MGLLDKRRQQGKDDKKPVGDKPAAAAVAGEGRGRKSPYIGKRIYLKVKENPYRKDSMRFKNFDQITEGMTFEDYQKKGLSTQVLKLGIIDKYVDVR